MTSVHAIIHTLHRMQFPPLSDPEDEKIVTLIYHTTSQEVVSFCRRLQRHPLRAWTRFAPAAFDRQFEDRFRAIIWKHLMTVGQRRYATVGMRLAKLMLEALERAGIYPGVIEHAFYLFLRVCAIIRNDPSELGLKSLPN